MRTKLAAVALGTTLALGAGVGLSQVADAQGDRMQHRDERLQAKVDEGVITQERADEIRERMGNRAERRDNRQAQRDEHTEELATILGTTADELKADLRAGESLAEIAEAAGIDVDVLIDQIEANQIESINQALADGRIDQEHADARLETLRDDITARVNGEQPEGRRGLRHRHGG